MISSSSWPSLSISSRRKVAMFIDRSKDRGSISPLHVGTVGLRPAASLTNDLHALGAHVLVRFPAENEHVPGREPLHELLGQVADQAALLGEHLVVGLLGYGAQVQEVDHPGAGPAAEPSLGLVVPQLGVHALEGVLAPQVAEHLQELLLGKVAVAVRPADHLQGALSTSQRCSRDMPTRLWESTSRQFSEIATRSMCLRCAARHSTAHSTRSSFSNTSMRPLEVSPRPCPLRPMRCRPLATDFGDPICTTRSTNPMSMPSSSEVEETTHFSFALLQPLLDVQPDLLGQGAVVGLDALQAHSP